MKQHAEYPTQKYKNKQYLTEEQRAVWEKLLETDVEKAEAYRFKCKEDNLTDEYKAWRKEKRFEGWGYENEIND